MTDSNMGMYQRMRDFEQRMTDVFSELYWSNADCENPNIPEMKERARMMLKLAQMYYDDTYDWDESDDIIDDVDETNYNPYAGQDEYECVWFEDI